MSIPEPSRRPFPYPLDAEALRYFCHPRHEVFRRVVRYDGAAWAANGYAAVRVSRGFLTFDDTLADPYPEFRVAMAKLPWHLVEGEAAKAGTWREMDAKRGTIYRGGSDRILPLWADGKMTEATPVMTAESCTVPLAMLQLLARLPKSEIRMATGAFLAVRFSGGEAIIPGRWRHQAFPPSPKFALFCSRDTSDDL
jgi:hypothetical protein